MQNDHTSIVDVYQALVAPEAWAGHRIASSSLSSMMGSHVSELLQADPWRTLTFADLACGAGADAYAMATGGMFWTSPISKPTTRLLVSDVNSGMVEKTKLFLENKKDLLATDIQYATCDLTKYELPGHWQNQADAVLIANTAVLFDEQQLQAALTTAKFPLKQNGRIYIDFRDWEDMVEKRPGTKQWENEINGTTYVVRYDYHLGEKPDDTHSADITVTVKDRDDIQPAKFSPQYKGISATSLAGVFDRAGLEIANRGRDERGPQLSYNTFELKLAA